MVYIPFEGFLLILGIVLIAYILIRRVKNILVLLSIFIIVIVLVIVSIYNPNTFGILNIFFE